MVRGVGDEDGDDIGAWLLVSVVGLHPVQAGDLLVSILGNAIGIRRDLDQRHRDDVAGRGVAAVAPVDYRLVVQRLRLRVGAQERGDDIAVEVRGKDLVQERVRGKRQVGEGIDNLAVGGQRRIGDDDHLSAALELGPEHHLAGLVDRVVGVDLLDRAGGAGDHVADADDSGEAQEVVARQDVRVGGSRVVALRRGVRGRRQEPRRLQAVAFIVVP